MVWLTIVLKDGPVLASQLLEKGVEQGFTKATLYAASKKLNVQHPKVGGFHTAGLWTLPG